jgi:hypothetical protein
MRDPSAYVADLIGRPWDARGLHCWALVERTVRDLWGVELPAVLEAPGRRAKAALFAGHPARAGWREARPPLPWAVALMHRRGGPPELIEHAGVYLPLDGGVVLHVDHPHGVVVDSLFALPRVRVWAAPVLMVPL